MISADEHLLEQTPVTVLAAYVDTANTAARTATIRIPAWDAGAGVHGPAPYTPHPNPHPAEAADVLSHPVNGTPCVVLEDTDGGLWIATWRYSA